ncbi:MAG: Uma2 family endonuclease, partial [Planctomycetes bacterium]|nr:Uma2 family endonuclease [Planctomycetota bacterium]
EGYLEGPPELIAEVAASSVSYDLHQKLHVYRRHGVREYLVHRVDDGEVDWFVLEAGQYVRMQPDDEGLLRSRTFPGLWLSPQLLLAGDLRGLRDLVERGCREPAHSAFAAGLLRS